MAKKQNYLLLIIFCFLFKSGMTQVEKIHSQAVEKVTNKSTPITLIQKQLCKKFTTSNLHHGMHISLTITFQSTA